jgi:hypothetical protein
MLVAPADRLSFSQSPALRCTRRSRTVFGELGRLFVDGRNRMAIRDVLVPVLLERFSDRGLLLGTRPDPIASFPANHPDVGDAKVWDEGFGARVAVGEIARETFHLWPSDDAKEATDRIAKSVVRFLQELFGDRLLFWQSIDGRNPAWRERGDVGHSEPLVLDDRIYRTYLWSGPLSLWQATPTIFARGHIRDDREYQIMFVRLNDAGPDGFQGSERDVASQLAADYERKNAI